MTTFEIIVWAFLATLVIGVLFLFVVALSQLANDQREEDAEAIDEEPNSPQQ